MSSLYQLMFTRRTFFYIPLILLVSFTFFYYRFAKITPQAIFIFGDSTVDVGTNSFIPDCGAKADFPYYGVDFVNSIPTGRFSNGFNIADFLCKLLGLKRSPESFLFLSQSGNFDLDGSPSWWLLATDLARLGSNLHCKIFQGRNCNRFDIRRKTFRGVNFASGGSGISDTTGQSLKIVSMSEQIKQFAAVHSNLNAKFGKTSTRYMLSRSIFFISSGNNDVIEHFETNSRKPKEQFIAALMTAYESYIKVLYKHGARKFGIISVLPTGCCPSRRFFNATGGCLRVMNDFCSTFHSSIKTLLHKISLEHEDFRYSLGNPYEIIMNVIENPNQYNLKYVTDACCGTGLLNSEQSCNPTTNMCENRKEYLFWDRNHLTQVASGVVARMLYGGELKFVSPVNIGKLVANN